MKRFWNHLKQQTWRMILPLLLMMVYGTNVFAAPTPSFNATTSGTANNLTLTAHLNVADADVGQAGNVYLGFTFQNAWIFNNGSNWIPFVSGAGPIYAAGPLTNRTIEVVRNADLSPLIGGQLYVGYGLSESDMLTNGKFGMIYTVVADTTPPEVSRTVIENGATNVAINATIGATFSEPMDHSTITSTTITLMQNGMPVTGTVVSYSGGSVSFVSPYPLTSNTNYTATIKGGANGVKDLAGNTLASDFIWSWTTGTTTARLAPVLLGTAGNFAILAKTGISTVPTSIITGNIGVSPAAATFITGFSLSADATNVFATSTQVVGGGRIYAANYAVPAPASLTTAILDMQTAYTDAAGRPTPDFTNLGSGTIGGLTLTPGLYTWGSSVMITADVTIAGGADDVWIFQMSGDLIMDAAKRITLSGGAQAKNIFWQVAGQATIGTTAHFEGVILSQTGITLQTGASMNGRILAQSLAALDSATVTQPAP